MNSGPQSTRIAKRDDSMTATMVRRLGGHSSTGPSGVLDQSMLRMSAPASPPPRRQSSDATMSESMTQ